jgi:ankyrin repeat protein
LESALTKNADLEIYQRFLRAVVGGQIEEINDAIRTLVSIGVDVNTKSGDGNTPLLRACGNGNIEQTQFLVFKGADVNVKDNDGRTPLHKAVRCFGGVKLTNFLIAEGANVNVRDVEGDSPLHFAVWNDKVFKFLVSNGADVNVKNKEGKTPLDLRKEQESMDGEKWDEEWN